MLLKITNLFDQHGVADYKGLDIEQFLAGAQVYDLENSTAYIVSQPQEHNHPDVTEIEEVEYLSMQEALKAKDTAGGSQEEFSTSIAQLKAENEELRSQMIDLWEIVLMGGE